MRSEWAKYINDDARRVDRERKAGDAQSKIKPPSKQMIVDWVVTALQKLRERSEMIHKSFVVTGIAMPLNGSQDHLYRKGEDGRDDDEDFYGFGDEAVNTVASDLSDITDSDTETISE